MKFLGKLVLWLFGWKVEGEPPPDVQRCVLVSGPHTSNWDTVFASACMHSLGVPLRIAIKKFWMQWPQRLIIRPLGGIAVDTENRKYTKTLDMVNAMADLFRGRERIALIISPEGDRNPMEKWKLGFYLIAKKAEVPIVLAYLDFEKKQGGFGPMFNPTDSKNDIMKGIMAFYSDKMPKHPDKFILDRRFWEKEKGETEKPPQ